MILQIALGIVLGYFLIGLMLSPVFWSILWRLITLYLCICFVVNIENIKLPEEYAICFLGIFILFILVSVAYSVYKEKHKDKENKENPNNTIDTKK